MSQSVEAHPLYRMINPRSIAFFGASNNFTSMGTIIFASFRALGFEGPVYPVHPREQEVQGFRAYRDVAQLPEVPDLAVMVLPTGIVNQTLEACGRKGIRNVVIVSGGFKEVRGEGEDRERELKEIAARYGIRVIGPNCLGVTNPHHRLNMTPFPYEGEPGFIGMASQSGSFVTQMFHYLHGLGLGFSTAVSVGNEADVDLVECIEYLGACPNTKVVALYIEGIRRGSAFVEVTRRVAARKPIVAFYVGGSEAGRRAGSSHTGALAGPDELYDGMFRQGCVIRAADLTELFDFCWVLGTLPTPEGPEVGLLTDSGGPGTAGADACSRAGLRLPEFSERTVEKLRAHVPHTGSLGNPVDLTFHKNPKDFYTEIPKAILEDPRVRSLLVYFLMPVEFIERAMMHMGVPNEEIAGKIEGITKWQGRAFADLMHTHGKPIVGYTWRGLEEPTIRTFMERGIPVFPGARRAARALAALVRYGEIRKRLLAAV